MYVMRNINNNIVSILCGDSGNYIYCSGHFIMYINIKPVWYTPKMNAILYANYSLKK